MSDYPYTPRRGFVVLLAGFAIGLGGTALVSSRIQAQIELNPQAVATVSGLVFVGLDFLSYSRCGKGQKRNWGPIPAPVKVLKDSHRGRRP